MSDTVRNTLSTLQRELQVEPEWLSTFDNGFRWWPGPLAQRIWIEDSEPRRLHIQTDLLKQVGHDDTQLSRVAYANQFATFSALILSPDDESLRLHASLLLSEEDGAEVNRLAFLTAAMQAADADAKCRGLAEFFHAEPYFTSHPSGGTRELGHDVLHALEALRAENDEAGSLAEVDFSPLEQWTPRRWVMAFAGKGGATAEFAFNGSDPALLVAASGDDSRPRTALLRLTTDFEHPQWQNGLLARLTLPVNGSPEVANALNLAEAYGPSVTGAYQLGAWCARDADLVFATFLPTVLFNRAVLADLVYGTAYRALWANAILLGAKDEVRRPRATR